MSVFCIAADTRKFKDPHVIDGRKLKFEYRSLGELRGASWKIVFPPYLRRVC